MSIEIRPYTENDIDAMRAIWNATVRDGIAFPQENEMTYVEAEAFFASQTACGAAVENGAVLGLFIVHPNNIGRCGHIANASYTVSEHARGKHVGRALVNSSITAARQAGFRILQFNAVVATNVSARHLYESIGFTQLGTIPGGFRMPDDTYVDICPYYIELQDAKGNRQ